MKRDSSNREKEAVLVFMTCFRLYYPNLINLISNNETENQIEPLRKVSFLLIVLAKNTKEPQDAMVVNLFLKESIAI